MQITSESIKVGHPDVVADAIAANIIAAILDEEKKLGLTVYNMPHCGLEVFLGKGFCVVGGEVATRALLIYPIVPAVVFGLFFNMGRKNGGTVPGAADNLSASALAVAMCRFLVENPSYIPDDTEIRFVSFGSEEAGYRGSQRYVERHLDELKRLDTRLLNFETIAHPEIAILTSEKNGTVKNSPDMVKSVVAAAQRARVPYKLQSAYLGVANDAGSFSQAGLKATTLLAFKVPQQMVAFYHQKWDTPEILSLEPLLNVLKLTFEWIRNGGE